MPSKHNNISNNSKISKNFGTNNYLRYSKVAKMIWKTWKTHFIMNSVDMHNVALIRMWWSAGRLKTLLIVHSKAPRKNKKYTPLYDKSESITWRFIIWINHDIEIYLIFFNYILYRTSCICCHLRQQIYCFIILHIILLIQLFSWHFQFWSWQIRYIHQILTQTLKFAYIFIMYHFRIEFCKDPYSGNTILILI